MGRKTGEFRAYILLCQGPFRFDIHMCRNKKGPGTVKCRSKHNKIKNSLRLTFYAATSFVRSSGLFRLHCVA